MDPDYSPPDAAPVLLRGLLATAHDRHFDMLHLVSELPEGALNWRAGEHVSSLAGLVHHIMHIESGALAEIAGNAAGWDTSNGARLERTGDEESLRAAIEAHSDAVLVALGGLREADLERPSSDGAPVGTRLVEEFDHAAMHLGHMQMGRLLWEEAFPGHPLTYEHWW